MPLFLDNLGRLVGSITPDVLADSTTPCNWKL
jgi:hypothetical protein